MGKVRSRLFFAREQFNLRKRREKEEKKEKKRKSSSSDSSEKNWPKLMKRWRDLKQIYKSSNDVSSMPKLLMMPWNEEIVKTRQNKYNYMTKSTACRLMQHVVTKKKMIINFIFLIKKFTFSFSC